VLGDRRLERCAFVLQHERALGGGAAGTLNGYDDGGGALGMPALFCMALFITAVLLRATVLVLLPFSGIFCFSTFHRFCSNFTTCYIHLERV
jgi:hypothetical protein